MDEPILDRAILDYYESSWDEDARIRSGIHELELVRTREIVERYLLSAPLRILDVGGASGVHSEWLLNAGHSVDLVDPVPGHVDEANVALGDKPGFSATVGDAPPDRGGPPPQVSTTYPVLGNPVVGAQSCPAAVCTCYLRLGT